MNTFLVHSLMRRFIRHSIEPTHSTHLSCRMSDHPRMAHVQLVGHNLMLIPFLSRWYKCNPFAECRWLIITRHFVIRPWVRSNYKTMWLNYSRMGSDQRKWHGFAEHVGRWRWHGANRNLQSQQSLRRHDTIEYVLRRAYGGWTRLVPGKRLCHCTSIEINDE